MKCAEKIANFIGGTVLRKWAEETSLVLNTITTIGQDDMNADEFVALVEQSRTMHPSWFDLPSDKPADDETLNQVESDLQVKLPDEYRWFLRVFGGGDFAFSRIYSADPDSDLFVTANQPAGGQALVAFADDGTGNLIGFPVREGECLDDVWVYDHQDGELRPSGFGTFLEYLAKLGLRSS